MRFFKDKERIGSLEAVLNAVVNLLHKKDLVRREEIQIQILEDAQSVICKRCGADMEQRQGYKECSNCGKIEEE